MAELKNCRDEANASAVMCSKKLIQMQKNLATAPKKVKASSARAVSMTKKQEVETTQYEELRLSMEQREGFANKEMARLKAKAVKVTQEWDASVAKAE